MLEIRQCNVEWGRLQETAWHIFKGFTLTGFCMGVKLIYHPEERTGVFQNRVMREIFGNSERREVNGAVTIVTRIFIFIVKRY